MRAELLESLLCPRCQGALSLTPRAVEWIEYAAGKVEEVREGTVACPCGLSLPVEDYVLSYDALMPEGVKADGRYWGSFYRFALSRGIKGHFDLKEGFPPLLQQGVFATSPQPEGERQGTHSFMADHELVRDSRKVLDIGCGAGWSSLFLARRGFEVVAFDPSLEVIRLAKRYAIEAGVFVEYLCAGLGFARFRDETFDAAFALHCLHHIPDLGPRMAEVHRLIRTGGCLCVDDHHQRNDHADLLAAALRRWVDTAIVPRFRARDPQAMADFPPGGSAHEDVSLGETLRQAQRLFHIRYLDMRYTFLDMLSTAFFLDQGQSPAAFEHAQALTGVLYQAWREADPDGAEYVTFVAQKQAALPTRQPAIQRVDISQSRAEVAIGELLAVVSQPFSPAADHLCALAVQLATYGRANTGPVTFRLWDADSGAEIARAEFEAADVINNGYRRFAFDPVASSKGRRYVFSLESPEARPGNAITVLASAAPVPGIGPFSAGGRAAQGTLTFRTWCAVAVSEVGNPQKTVLQRAAYVYWQGGLAELMARVKARLGRLLTR